MSGDWHKICTEEYETAEAESFGALAGWCYGNNETPPKLTEVLTDALRAAFAGAFNHGYEACIADPPAALSAPSEPVQDKPRVWAMPEIPEDVTRLRDRTGNIWHRDRMGEWEERRHPPGLTGWGICDLLATFGPLEEVVEP